MHMSDPRRALSLVILDGADGRPADRCKLCRSFRVWVVASKPLVDRLRELRQSDPNGTYCMGKIGSAPCPASLKALSPVSGLQKVLR